MTQEQGMGAQQADGLSPTVEPLTGLAGSATSIPSALMLRLASVRDFAVGEISFWAQCDDDESRGRVLGIDSVLGSLHAAVFNGLADAAQAIEAGTAETEGFGPQGESAVLAEDAPQTPHPHRT